LDSHQLGRVLYQWMGAPEILIGFFGAMVLDAISASGIVAIADTQRRSSWTPTSRRKRSFLTYRISRRAHGVNSLNY